MQASSGKRWWWVCGLLAALLAGGPAAGQEYQIKLVRPEQVGAKYQVTKKTTIDIQRTYRRGDQAAVVMEHHEVLEYEGQEEIAEIDAAGRSVKVVCTIGRLFRTLDRRDGKERTKEAIPLLGKGQVVMVTSTKDSRKYEAKGLELSAKTKVALWMNIRLPLVDEKLRDDDLFGTKEKQKVGATWTGDRKAWEQWADGKIPVDQINARTKLARLTKLDGVDCLEIRMETQYPSESGAEPEHLILRSGQTSETITCVQPVDVQLTWFDETRHDKANNKYDIRNEGAIIKDMECHETSESRYEAKRRPLTK